MNTAELNRLTQNLIRIGTIAVVDHAARRLKVASGKLLTAWLDWPAEIGRNYKRWQPLRIGTQVILACPGGDPAQAIIIGMLYSNSHPSPSTDPDIDLIQFDNGSFIAHNHSAKTLTLHSAGDLIFSAKGQISHRAEQHNISGPVTQTGGDSTSDGISAQIHKHGGIAKGLDITKVPEG